MAMGFLIKSAFWFSLVLLALPLDAGTDAAGHKVGAIEALVAAGAAVNDLAGICERKPHVCEVGRSALSTIGARAKVAARMASDSLEGSPAGPTPSRPVGADAVASAIDAADADMTPTGSIPIPTPRVQPK